MPALLGLEQLCRVFLSLWEAGVTYLLLYSRIIFHPSISWGLNEGDEYPGISLITIKAFQVQRGNEEEAQTPPGMLVQAQEIYQGFPSPFLGAVKGHNTVPSSLCAQHPQGNLWLCISTGSSSPALLPPTVRCSVLAWKSRCVNQLLISCVFNGKVQLKLGDKTPYINNIYMGTQTC